MRLRCPEVCQVILCNCPSQHELIFGVLGFWHGNLRNAILQSCDHLLVQQKCHLLRQTEESIIALACEIVGRAWLRAHALNASQSVHTFEPSVCQPASEATWHEWNVGVADELELLGVGHNPPAASGRRQLSHASQAAG